MNHLFKNGIENKGIDMTRFFTTESMNRRVRLELALSPILSCTLTSRHYTSLVRHPSSDVFRHFNDDYIRDYSKRVVLCTVYRITSLLWFTEWFTFKIDSTMIELKTQSKRSEV